MMESMAEEAVRYAMRGLAVIALAPRDKRPTFPHGLNNATTDYQYIREWWIRHPNNNIAIATGEVSGNIGVIDIDVDEESGKDGFEFLHQWEKEHGELPETWTVKTGRGGQHLYYRFKCEIPRNTANTELAIDFRGEGGYVMAPPSIHPNGRQVEWDLHPDDYKLAYANDNVMAFIEAIRPKYVSKAAQRFELPEVINKGSRDDVLFRFACSLQAQGVDDAQISVMVHDANERRCNPPMKRREVDTKIRQALRYPKGETMAIEAKTFALEEDGKGNPLQTLTNHIYAMENDPKLAGRFRYDNMSYTRVVKLPLPWRGGEGFVSLRDSDYCELNAYIESKYKLKSKAKATDAIIAVCERNRFNPLQEWLDTLVWDGQDRVSLLFAEFLGASPSDYVVAAAHLTLRGAVARAYNPGCKFDYMPVLVGSQGIGKSYFVSRLAMRPEWYLDNLNTFDGDPAVEKLRGKWVVEVAELTAMKRQKDLETIKAFISTTIDTIRPKYGRETEQRPRCCVLIGTTNDYSFMTDKTGNRRYLPIDCSKTRIVLDLFNTPSEYFEQCWAQAVAEYKTNPRVPLIMPREVERYTQEAIAAHVEEDPRVGMIQEWLDNRARDMTDQEDPAVCISMVCEYALHMQPYEYQGKRSVTNEIARIMQNEIHGWHSIGQHKLLGGYGNQRCYEPDTVTNIGN